MPRSRIPKDIRQGCWDERACLLRRMARACQARTQRAPPALPLPAGFMPPCTSPRACMPPFGQPSITNRQLLTAQGHFDMQCYTCWASRIYVFLERTRQPKHSDRSHRICCTANSQYLHTVSCSFNSHCHNACLQRTCRGATAATTHTCTHPKAKTELQPAPQPACVLNQRAHTLPTAAPTAPLPQYHHDLPPSIPPHQRANRCMNGRACYRPLGRMQKLQQKGARSRLPHNALLQERLCSRLTHTTAGTTSGHRHRQEQAPATQCRSAGGTYVCLPSLPGTNAALLDTLPPGHT